MICSSSTSLPLEQGGADGWLDLGVKIASLITPIFLPVSLFVYRFVRLFVFLLYFYVILNIFVFFIHNMLKCQNKITIDFVEGHPSSFNIMTFCQVFHGGCSLPLKYYVKVNFVECYKIYLFVVLCFNFSAFILFSMFFAYLQIVKSVVLIITIYYLQLVCLQLQNH